ncbi:hypothetical protein Dtox_2045 [Desulfofarcimen acetoxidans DSM 771]|jgi:UDP-N-acetylmuramyl pentapeptide phosphotransferase/UDP-N-acetylglucosamine-1-phosphate transferase|uniref:Glycosyl transferase family 4 n=1 Tax=Desulfofarcimen acetoxidans (strain ATCC 49208 / DSM 771 / KCTC 5769 / VKM B-1644 / 5575) TaxID=485916 RepID=C8VYW4_DESAS|nr:hypothetical protein [Desulfofarcimen acetoxidans]ACV62874.1 hypothetical protein Dtox_2045 [Desulfofarcimen acetoxidans DSM 771]
MAHLLETKCLFLFLNFLIGYIITLVLIKPIINMISTANFVRPNFRGENIPVGVGIIFLISSSFVITLNLLFLNIVPHNLTFLTAEEGFRYVIFLAGIASITCLGLIDDNWGSRDTTGLKGHLLSLFRGKITTGGLKAMGGGFISLIISLLPGQNDHIILNTLILGLSINAINLLDLRPGRAGKGFLLGALLLAAYGQARTDMLFVYIFLGLILAYLPYDLKAKVMMGDSGSNALGITLGLTAVWLLSWQLKIYLLTGLIVLHLLTEKYSLTKIIEKNIVLNYLDRLGRN